MSPPKDDYDRDNRPSWSEIDKRKDKSSHRDNEPKSKMSPKEQAWVKTAALKEASGLFDQKLSPTAKKLLDDIQKALGTEDFAKLINKYLNKYGLPGKWRHLLEFLDHPDPDVFLQITQTMAENYKSQPMVDRRSFKTKLSILSNTAKSAKIMRIAKKTKESL